MPKAKFKGKEEAKRRIKLDQITRENRYSRNTISRAEKEWRKLCSSISLPSLRDGLIFTWRSFERLIDMKDFVISLYMDEVKEQEESYMMMYRNHQDNIRRTMEQFDSMLHEIHQENNEELQNLIRLSLKDWQRQAEMAESGESYVKIMSYGLQMQKKNCEKHTKTENFAKINEETSKNQHEIQQLSFLLELKLEDNWQRIQNCQNDYLHRASESQKQNDDIKRIDEANNRTVRRELKKLLGLHELVKKLTGRSKQLVNSIGEKLRYTESEKESLNECYFALRNKLQRERDQDAIKRTVLTVEFFKTFDYLEKKMKEGDKIIRLLRCCHNLEIIDEKILPYPGDINNSQQILPQLKLFWQRVAQVDSIRYTLGEERLFLKMENRKLRQEIHKHCQCLDCPVLPPIPNRFGKVPYTEGVEMIRRISNQVNTRRDSQKNLSIDSSRSSITKNKMKDKQEVE